MPADSGGVTSAASHLGEHIGARAFGDLAAFVEEQDLVAARGGELGVLAFVQHRASWSCAAATDRC